ncbi:MAG: ribbon-helix-helix protein, CopG family [Pseudomonadota bacterium]
MTAISVRLPDDLETQLTHEAKLEGKPRAEVARAAIADYLARKERERFMAEMVAEARAAYANEAIQQESREIAEDFLPLENETLDKVTAGETGEKWWK